MRRRTWHHFIAAPEADRLRDSRFGFRFRAPVSISLGLQTGVIFSIVPAWRPSYVKAVAILSSHLA
jgi:hypothetical protein